MQLPIQAQPVARRYSFAKQAEGGVHPSGCPWYKIAYCAVAVAACGASCLLGPEVCIPCLAGIGLPSCIDCF